MCRNIKMLFNFDPPVTDAEVRNASLQFVRKISGCNKPSKANEEAFQTAVDEIAAALGIVNAADPFVIGRLHVDQDFFAGLLSIAAQIRATGLDAHIALVRFGRPQA